MAWTPTTTNPYYWYTITKTRKAKGIILNLFAVAVYQCSMQYVLATPAQLDENGNPIAGTAQTLPVKAGISFKVFNTIQDGLDDFSGNALEDFTQTFYFPSMNVVESQIKDFLKAKYNVNNANIQD